MGRLQTGRASRRRWNTAVHGKHRLPVGAGIDSCSLGARAWWAPPFKRSVVPRSSSLCCWALCLEVALILYLAIQGRMPTRVLWLVFLPFMALVAGLLPSCIPGGFDSASSVWPQRWGSAVGCCASLGLMLAEVIPHLLPDIEGVGSHRGIRPPLWMNTRWQILTCFSFMI